MSASDNLSQQLFHGTIQKFKKGDIIVPAKAIGEMSNWGMLPHKEAFATEHLDAAKYFASASRVGLSRFTPQERPKRATERVYEVEPIGPTKIRNLQGSKRKYSEAIVEHASPEGFRVKKQVWSRPRPKRMYDRRSRAKHYRPEGMR